MERRTKRPLYRRSAAFSHHRKRSTLCRHCFPKGHASLVQLESGQLLGGVKIRHRSNDCGSKTIERKRKIILQHCSFRYETGNLQYIRGRLLCIFCEQQCSRHWVPRIQYIMGGRCVQYYLHRIRLDRSYGTRLYSRYLYERPRRCFDSLMRVA